MKRSQEEALRGSQPKRPKTHRGQQSGLTKQASSYASGIPGSDSIGEVLAYLGYVNTALKHDRDTYVEFLLLVSDFRLQRVETDQVVDRVKQLFQGQPDLILGFNKFLPEGYKIDLPGEERMAAEANQGLNLLNKIERCIPKDSPVYKAFLGILRKYRTQNVLNREACKEIASLIENYPDLHQEFRCFFSDALGPVAPKRIPPARVFSRRDVRSSVMPVEHEASPVGSYTKHDSRRRQLEKEKERKEDRDRRDVDWNEDFDQHTRAFNNVQLKKEPPRRIDGMVHEQFQQGVYSKDFIYLEKLKQKLHEEKYREFLKCLDLYRKETVARSELINLVSNIFEENQDLINDFDEFLTNCENSDELLAGQINKRNLSRPTKEEARHSDKEHERVEERNLEREKDRERESLNKSSSFVSKDAACQRAPLYLNEEWKPISELDLSNCKRCSPSYRLLPKNYLIPPSRHRTELAASVLNDRWVSVTSGSEDYSFKRMRKNQYEERLFRCEDDRFELDMLLESVNTTIRKVENLLEILQHNTIEPQNQICIEEEFTSLNLRCIERLYGDHGLDLMDILRNNASLALPFILTRLKQKQEEWLRCRSDFNKVWAEVYAKNFQKSLDHQSFYFKQQDAKNLSTNALVAGLREMDENNQDDVLLTIGAGSGRTCGPSMTFDYEDSDIHEDLHAIMKYSCGELCTSTDQLDQVMRIWTTFLEPMLGVDPNPQRADDTGDGAKSKIHFVKDSVTSAGESKAYSGAVAFTKGSNPLSNTEETVPPKQGSSCSGRLENATAMQDGNCVACIDDSLCRNIPDGKEQTGAPGVGEMFAVPGKGASMHSPKSGNLGLKLELENPLCGKALPCSEGVDNICPATSGNGDNITRTCKFDKHKEDSASPDDMEIEREEGELSPDGNSEEANLLVFEHMSANIELGVKDGSSSMERPVKPGELEDPCGETAGDDDVDAHDKDEESTPRSLDDSENASGGEDVSGSESVNGDDCSHGDYEEEDADDDHQDRKAESEGQAEGMTDGNGIDGEITSLPISDCFLYTVKPLAEHVPGASNDGEYKGSCVLYGNDSLYVLFRLHQTLYQRILSAKRNSSTAERKWKSLKNTRPPDLYAKFMGALRDLLDGSSDNTKFEDDCRAIIGTQSYVLFTLDKLIHKIVKKLQSIAADEMDSKLLQLHLYEKSRHARSFVDLVYHKNACVLLHDKSIYRLERSSNPTRLAIQLMKHGHEEPEDTPVSMDPNFSTYLFTEFLSIASSWKNFHGIFLGRNKCKYGSDDEASATCKAMKGIYLVNGLECKILCSSSRVSYVQATEDSLFRQRKKRKYEHDQRRFSDGQAAEAQLFHNFLTRQIET